VEPDLKSQTPALGI